MRKVGASGANATLAPSTRERKIPGSIAGPHIAKTRDANGFSRCMRLGRHSGAKQSALLGSRWLMHGFIFFNANAVALGLRKSRRPKLNFCASRKRKNRVIPHVEVFFMFEFSLLGRRSRPRDVRGVFIVSLQHRDECSAIFSSLGFWAPCVRFDVFLNRLFTSRRLVSSRGVWGLSLSHVFDDTSFREKCRE